MRKSAGRLCWVISKERDSLEILSVDGSVVLKKCDCKAWTGFV